MTAALGLGTYRLREVTAAAERAATSPAPWIDTAPNYLHGSAQAELAPVLAAHPEVPVSTKVGFLTNGIADDAIEAGVLNPDQANCGHAIAPAYLRWQLDRNRAELRRNSLDLVFLHNPERITDRPELFRQLREAFAVLEEQALAGDITAYGIATWAGFSDAAFTVAELVRLATEAAGGPRHHLRAIQLPLSLVMSAPMAQALHGNGPIADAAAAGLDVFASAPLHGGELPRLATAELAELIQPGLTTAQACLLATASCPGVTRVLLSASNAAHWADARAALSGEPISPDHLRKILDVLGS
jgi:aryl-alcohol dehydrogenase-like predicted oxidoreductase